MKQFATLLLLVASVAPLAAQDIIVTRASERIEAKIIRVTENEVEYKRQNNPDGPTFVIATENVSSILYANGDAQAFRQQATRSEPQGISSPKGLSSRHFISFGYNRITIKDEAGAASLTTGMNGLYVGIGAIYSSSLHVNFRPSFILSYVSESGGHIFDAKAPLLVGIGGELSPDFSIHACIGP